MSQWTHGICEHCWRQREPNREPTRMRDAKYYHCCQCMSMQPITIFIRHDPNTMNCRGLGSQHEDDG